ncbi:Major facilitator superfamily MFS_1 [Trichormus variabilis ATCC 29413]|uniref:Major facilitator superfamily MFS_1 n=2 Tax=Anabaena variabilis TaxID=264691 RepID=Q3MFF8_TRIV2|nr:MULTISPECIES: MFS transporter [Nostocaceae]ABA20278.1 Major facilitator superfamily MFS_1 [Trichormus variabilis ATCC 29413]MBC1212744.1 MFS transporter [Trichormus variabilis ARAD]MBC1258710.1 MFS transporter [Trichormus variabilis V5]MBC1269886.1 MFS transporter [Trichormus variabilis FSR]MBC1304254.1 MFS transporter [Trichormus variabilis N2B]
MVNSVNTRPEILWRQVWGLAALLAAIIFSWMAYKFYQPRILEELEFVGLVRWLGIWQGLLIAVIEPMIGGLSDRIQQRLGSRLPMISLGVVLAGVIFVAVSLLVQQNLPIGIRWVVPMLMTVWVIAIIIFRAPAIALLTQFAPKSELPQANAVLVFVLGLIGAISPVLNTLLDNMGASITFLVGAIALILAAYILQLFTPKHLLHISSFNLEPTAKTPVQMFILIFIIGLGTGIELNLLLSIFPQELQIQLPNLTVEFIASAILLVSAIVSVPLGDWTTQLGANKSMLLGLGAMTAFMGLALLNDSDKLAIAFILAFGISFSLVFISMIPLVLSKVHPSRAGLGTGLYFGGSAGGTAIVSFLIKELGNTSIGAFLLAEFAFVLVGVCILLSRRFRILPD